MKNVQATATKPEPTPRSSFALALSLLCTAMFGGLLDHGALAADAFEEDDGCIASETVIRGADLQSHDFEDDAEDWVAFNACPGRSYTIETLNLGVSADTVIELYDGDCTTLLASDDNGGTGLGSLLDWNASATGTYHLKVRQGDISFGVDREYDLSLTGDTSTCATWSFDLSGSGTRWIADKVMTPDGGFLAVGRVPEGAWLVKVDAEGSVEWEKTYDTGFEDMVMLDNGDLLVAGTTISEQMHVQRLDSQGNVIWAKNHDSTDTLTGARLLEVSQNDYRIVSISNIWDDIEGFWVGEIDGNGDILADRMYYSSLEILRVNAALWATGGGVVVAGSVYDDYTGFIVKLQTNGMTEWAKKYEINGELMGINGITETNDGDLVIAGQCTWNQGSGGGCLVKVDSTDGTVVWSRLYDTAVGDTLHYVEQVSDGGFMATGETDDFDVREDLWVLRTDASGTLLWQRSFAGNPKVDTALLQVPETPDGGMIVSGWTYPDLDPLTFGSDVRMFRLAEDGTADAGCATEVRPITTVSPSITVTDLSLTIDPTSATTTTPTVTATPASHTYTAFCGFACMDGDIDGFGLPGNHACLSGSGTDCDDGDATAYPGAPEVCGDAINNDCDEPSWPDPNAVGENDGDLDGSPACADCNDADPDTHPDAPETNDGLDNQCAGDAGFGLIDELSGDPTFTDPDTFCWPAQPGATLYEIARSTDPDHSSACYFSNEIGTCHSDTDVPPAGEVYYYLVRASAPNTGSWGEDTSGQERFPQCGVESFCDDGLDNDNDGDVDCADSDCAANCVATYQFTDSSGDDVAQDSLFDFFQGLTPATTDFIYVEMSGSGQTRRFCATRADWYRDNYIAMASSSGMQLSASWDFWYTLDGTSWTYDPHSRVNRYGGDCNEAYSWCAEEQTSLLISVRPGRTDDCEASEHFGGIPVTCSPIDTIVINVGSDRLLTCGF